jgi:hypothetical protein
MIGNIDPWKLFPWIASGLWWFALLLLIGVL